MRTTYDMKIESTQGHMGIVRPRLYTLDELSEELKMSRSDIYKIIKSHIITPVFPKRPFKYKLGDVQNALNEDIGENLYVVSKNIPIPPAKTKVSELKDRFRDLVSEFKVGDSFVAPQEKVATLRIIAKEANMQVTSRRIGNTETFRIWRVA